MNHPAPTFSPLYRQIKGLIMQSLESAEWRPGEAIPSEIELAARYKVSQGTVRKAIDELAAEKHLLRRQGKGTFVATHDEARAQFRFLRLMPDEGEQEEARGHREPEDELPVPQGEVDRLPEARHRLRDGRRLDLRGIDRAGERGGRDGAHDRPPSMPILVRGSTIR